MTINLPQFERSLMNTIVQLQSGDRVTDSRVQLLISYYYKTIGDNACCDESYQQKLLDQLDLVRSFWLRSKFWQGVID